MSFASGLRRNYWVVPLLLLGTTAVVSARGVSAVARWAVGPTATERAAASLSLVGAARDPARLASADPILARNPFDGAGVALSRPRAPADDAPADTTAGPAAAPPCEGVRLLVSVSSSDPEFSLASFEAGGEGKNVLGRRGDSVAGKQVEYIGWDRAFLSSAGSLCQARLFQPSAPSATPTRAAPVVSPAGSVDPSIGRGIRKLSPGQYEIDRAVLDRIVDSQGDLLKSIRVVPDKQGEGVKGLKLLGIKSGSLLSLLGMENGDRLQTINGFDVTSPEKALEAYARLRSGADRLTVRIERGGSTQNLDYDVR